MSKNEPDKPEMETHSRLVPLKLLIFLFFGGEFVARDVFLAFHDRTTTTATASKQHDICYGNLQI